VTRRENPGVSTNMRNFQRTLQREDLENNMNESGNLIEQGWLRVANLIESEIQAGIERLDESVRSLENQIPLSEEEQLNRSLMDTRDLLTRYNEIMETLRQNTEAGKTEESRRQEQLNRSEQGNQQNQQGKQSQQNRQTQQGKQSQQTQQQQAQQGQQQAQQGQRQGGSGARDQRTQAARLQQQIENMRQQLEELQRRGGSDQNMQNALRSIQNYLGGKLHNTGVLLDDAAQEYFKQKVYAPLSQLENRLLQKLDEIEMEKKLYGSRKADVPPQYRKLVDKYYESISKSKKKK